MGKRWDRFAYGSVATQERAITQVPWGPYGGEWMTWNGVAHFASGQTTWGDREPVTIAGERQAVLSNGVVYGIFRTRADLFSQVRFCWKRFGSGPRPMASDVFTDRSLAPLDNPSPILEWCELDVADAGNSYWTLDGGILRRLPARWCSIVLGSQRDSDDPLVAWDAEPVGLIYQPDGFSADRAEVFRWDEIAHYCPERDPDARFRGMSWLRPVLEDVRADNGARRYLTKFWENNATPNLFMKFPAEVEPEKIRAFRDIYLAKHQGVSNAFRTGFIGGGADPMVVGSSLKDLDAEHIRTQLHKDIAAAAGVPIVAAGIEQGTYANSKESNRALADRKIRYLWLRAVEAFRPLFPAPSGAELWYDATSVAALQSDAIDDASVMVQQANTMRTLVDGGFVPDSVIQAVTTGDLDKLQHSGLLSVQTQSPGTGNGNGGDDG